MRIAHSVPMISRFIPLLAAAALALAPAQPRAQTTLEIGIGIQNTTTNTVTGGIAPSPYANVGENVIRAIASYAGKPVGTGRGQATAYALVDTRRYTIARGLPPPRRGSGGTASDQGAAARGARHPHPLEGPAVRGDHLDFLSRRRVE